MDRLELINAIELIKAGVQENSVIEEAKNVTFNMDYISSDSDDIAISVPYPIGIKGEISATDFLKLLKKLKAKELTIVKNDRKEFEISCGKTLAGFRIFNEDIEQSLDLSNVEEWTKLPEDFSKGLRFCSFSAANEGSVLDCLQIKDNAVVSSDHFRITRYIMDGNIPNEIKIHHKVVKELVNYDPIYMYDAGNRLHFKNEAGVVFTCRTLATEYPNVEEYLDPNDGTEIELPKELKEIVSRVKILAGKSEINTDFIRIYINEGNMVLISDNDIGWVEESIEIDYNGEEIQFQTNPNLLEQILPHVDTVNIGQHLYFKSDKFDHLIALMTSE